MRRCVVSLVFALVFALVACSPKKKETGGGGSGSGSGGANSGSANSGSATKDDAPSCAVCAAKMMKLASGANVKITKQVSDDIQRAVEQSCINDKWDVDARNCIGNLPDNPRDMAHDQCQRTLTPAQQHELERIIEAALEKADADANADTDADANANANANAKDAGARVLEVTSIEPTQGDVDGGTYAVVKGNDFIHDGPRSLKVYFGSRQGTVVRFQSDNEVVVQAPGGKKGETVDVLFIFEPGGQKKLVKAFTYKAAPPP